MANTAGLHQKALMQRPRKKICLHMYVYIYIYTYTCICICVLQISIYLDTGMWRYLQQGAYIQCCVLCTKRRGMLECYKLAVLPAQTSDDKPWHLSESKSDADPVR